MLSTFSGSNGSDSNDLWDEGRVNEGTPGEDGKLETCFWRAFVEAQVHELREHRRCVVELMHGQEEVLRKTEHAILCMQRGVPLSTPVASEVSLVSARERGESVAGPHERALSHDSQERRVDSWQEAPGDEIFQLGEDMMDDDLSMPFNVTIADDADANNESTIMELGGVLGEVRFSDEPHETGPSEIKKSQLKRSESLLDTVRSKEALSVKYRASVSAMRRDSILQRCRNRLEITVIDLPEIRGACRSERLASSIGSVTFTCIIAAIILLNAAYIGYSSHDHMRSVLEAFDRRSNDQNDAQTEASPAWQKYFDTFFTLAFAIELLLRIVAFQFDFFIGSDAGWNLFDTFLVVSSLIELAFASAGFDLTFLRVQRLLKMVRTFRILKIFRHFLIFRKLQTMVMAIVNSLIPLMWAMMLLFIVMFLFAVIFLLGVSDYINDADGGDATVAEFRIFFETMQMTVLTLWMAVSGGVSWWEIERLLLRISWLWGCLLPFFQAVMLLAMMNIITGIFVNDAVEMMSLDRELHSQLEQEKAQMLVTDLEELFHQMDDTKSGVLTQHELSKLDENPKLKAVLDSVQLDVHDVKSFFDILDVDENGVLEIEEFVMGAMYLKGNANMLDMAIFMRDNKKMMRKAFKLTESIAETACKIEKTLEGSLWLSQARFHKM